MCNIRVGIDEIRNAFIIEHPATSIVEPRRFEAELG